MVCMIIIINACCLLFYKVENWCVEFSLHNRRSDLGSYRIKVLVHNLDGNGHTIGKIVVHSFSGLS